MNKSRRNPILLAILVVNIVSTITQYEATRILLDDDQERVNILLVLPSLQWRSVSPPSSNPVTNKNIGSDSVITPCIVGQKNFIGQKNIDLTWNCKFQICL